MRWGCNGQMLGEEEVEKALHIRRQTLMRQMDAQVFEVGNGQAWEAWNVANSRIGGSAGRWMGAEASTPAGQGS